MYENLLTELSEETLTYYALMYLAHLNELPDYGLHLCACSTCEKYRLIVLELWCYKAAKQALAKFKKDEKDEK